MTYAGDYITANSILEVCRVIQQHRHEDAMMYC